jgi:hypothetical protein
VIDPGASVLTGTASVHGEVAAEGAPLFFRDGRTLNPPLWLGEMMKASRPSGSPAAGSSHTSAALKPRLGAGHGYPFGTQTPGNRRQFPDSCLSRS